MTTTTMELGSEIKVKLRVVLIATVLWSALPLGAPIARADGIECGETITSDTKLDSDLVNCPNNGIVIGADNVTLDLNGHVIDGDGSEFADCPPEEPCDMGVVNVDHDGTTIEGGTVREFGEGILVVGASGSRVTHVVVSNNLLSGLVIFDSSDSEIERITALGNGVTTDRSGMAVFDSHDLKITNNTVFENGDIGLFVQRSDNNRIENNSLWRNPEAGIILEGSGNELRRNRVSESGDGLIVFGDANTVTGNRVSDALGCPDGCGVGISLEGGTGTVIARNIIVRVRQAGIRVASFDPEVPTARSTVRRNRIEDSDADGVLIESTAFATSLARNTATGAADDGLDVDNAETKLTRNEANGNHDLGIEAVRGVKDGGGNKASGNGNPVQCTNVVCE